MYVPPRLRSSVDGHLGCFRVVLLRKSLHIKIDLINSV